MKNVRFFLKNFIPEEAIESMVYASEAYWMPVCAGLTA